MFRLELLGLNTRLILALGLNIRGLVLTATLFLTPPAESFVLGAVGSSAAPAEVGSLSCAFAVGLVPTPTFFTDGVSSTSPPAEASADAAARGDLAFAPAPLSCRGFGERRAASAPPPTAVALAGEGVVAGTGSILRSFLLDAAVVAERGRRERGGERLSDDAGESPRLRLLRRSCASAAGDGNDDTEPPEFCFRWEDDRAMGGGVAGGRDFLACLPAWASADSRLRGSAERSPGSAEQMLPEHGGSRSSSPCPRMLLMLCFAWQTRKGEH